MSIQNTPQDSHSAGIMKLYDHVTPSGVGQEKRKKEKKGRHSQIQP